MVLFEPFLTSLPNIGHKAEEMFNAIISPLNAMVWKLVIVRYNPMAMQAECLECILVSKFESKN